MLTEAGGKKTFRLLEEQIYDRQSFSEATGIVYWGYRREIKVLLRFALCKFIYVTQVFNLILLNKQDAFKAGSYKGVPRAL